MPRCRGTGADLDYVVRGYKPEWIIFYEDERKILISPVSDAIENGEFSVKITVHYLGGITVL